MEPLSEQVRAAVRASGMSNGEISRALGINKASVGRFMAGAGIGTDTLDKLGALLGLKVTRRTPPREKRRAA